MTSHSTLHGSMAMGATAAVAFFLIALLWLAYLFGVWRTRRQKPWPWWRTLLFTAGCATLAVAFAPELMHAAHQDVRMHMVAHLLLGMFAPLGLVFAAPMSLLLRNLPPGSARGLVRFLGTWPVRVLTHPITAAILDIGGMYLLYMTSLYAHSLHSPWISNVLHLHFVISGTLFTWAIAGPDPAPHRPGWRTRMAVLVAAMAAHATLGKLLYAFGFPRGTGAGVEELQQAAMWMYYWGDLAEAVLVGALMLAWLRRRRRMARSGGASMDMSAT
ncbi:cytochrome c oxidase assembly protein [Kushneria sp. EE4]